MRKNTPLTITNQIAAALDMPNLQSGHGRKAAVAEIISSFLNYTEKHDEGQQGFFAGMIIRILLPNDESVHFSDMQTVINIIKEGDKAIQDEMLQEREEWLAARKADRELALA
jgi:hemerythrin